MKFKRTKLFWVDKQRVPSNIYPGQSYLLLSYKWKQKSPTTKEKKAKKVSEAFEKYNKMSEEDKSKFRN